MISHGAFRQNIPGYGTVVAIDVLDGSRSEDPGLAKLCRQLGPILAEFGLAALYLPDWPKKEDVLSVVAVLPEEEDAPIPVGTLYVRLQEAFGCPVWLFCRKNNELYA